MLTLTALLIPLASLHFPAGDYNQVNPGVFVESQVDGTRWGLSAGAYYNSYRRVTATVQVSYTLVVIDSPVGPVGLGVSAGPATGYAVPVTGGFFASTKYVHLQFVPPVGYGTSGVAAVALRIPFGG